jgi:hypothetical protein
MAQALLELYVRRRGEGGAPERVLLDFDSTDDPAHGEQEGGSPTMATSASTSTIPCWSSTVIQGRLSPLCCVQAMLTPGPERFLY